MPRLFKLLTFLTFDIVAGYHLCRLSIGCNQIQVSGSIKHNFIEAITSVGQYMSEKGADEI